MRMGFYQMQVVHGNRKANWQRVRRGLEGVRCDLMVLPELFESGYAFESQEDAERQGEELSTGNSVGFLREIAQGLGGMVTGTVIERWEGKLYNTALLVNDEGLVGTQRKVHLTDYDKQFFSPGQKIQVFEARDKVRIGMMTCFDCWFPEFSATMKQKGAQVICNSCSFGGEVTPHIIPVRGLETQAFVVSCNRVGNEWFNGTKERFCGKSQIVTPNGEVILKAAGQQMLGLMDVKLEETQQPGFATKLCRDFMAEHNRYALELKA